MVKARTFLKSKNEESGQVVIEYILLLVIAVSVSAIISTSVVGRNQDSPGFLTKAWSGLIQFVATDQTDDTN